MKRIPVRAVAVVSILAGLGVLAIEIRRLRSGEGFEIGFWSLIAVLAVIFGVYELIAARRAR